MEEEGDEEEEGEGEEGVLQVGGSVGPQSVPLFLHLHFPLEETQGLSCCLKY